MTRVATGRGADGEATGGVPPRQSGGRGLTGPVAVALSGVFVEREVAVATGAQVDGELIEWALAGVVDVVRALDHHATVPDEHRHLRHVPADHGRGRTGVPGTGEIVGHTPGGNQTVAEPTPAASLGVTIGATR